MVDLDAYRIEAVTVNHNTSLFAELLLRSLLAKTPAGLDLSLTVMDNQSKDGPALASLQALCGERDIPFLQSGFDAGAKTVNTHGEVLRDFALSHADCTHYLFLDADVCVLHEHTLPTMLEELIADPQAFGIGAGFHIYWDDDEDGEEEDDDDEEEDDDDEEMSFTMNYSIKYWEGFERIGLESRTKPAPRLHPAFALVENTSLFRDVVREIGFSSAWTFEEGAGAFYDTFALMTRVMKTHGLHVKQSAVEVLHFFGVTYDELWQDEAATNSKVVLCRKMLAEYQVGDSE